MIHNPISIIIDKEMTNQNSQLQGEFSFTKIIMSMILLKMLRAT